jgi:hypothetical protein
MRSQFAFVAVFLCAIASRAIAATGDFVVASNLLDSQLRSNAAEEVGLISPTYNNFNNRKVGQSFVSQLSGILTSVDAMVIRGSVPLSAEPPLDVSIYSSLAGIPIAQLATLSFPASVFSDGFPLDQRKTFDFSQFQIPLDSSHEYMVTFGTAYGVNGSNGSNSPYLVDWSPSSLDGNHAISLGRNLSSAPDGINWQTRSFYQELGIVVRAIPEPSTLVLSILAFAVVPTRRRELVPQQSRLTSFALC